MRPTSFESLERTIRARCDSGDHRGATAALIEGYGPQLLGFLRSRLRDQAAADEAFSMLCEDVWQGMAGFGWRCTARAWAYTLARHAESRHRAARHRWAARNLPLSGLPEVMAIADRVRTTTRAYLRSEVKDRFRTLRERLPEEEQVILILRVDKRMSWEEIAYVVGAGESPADISAGRESVRLRKRFQLIKGKLRRWAEAEGLLSTTEDDAPAG